MAASAKPSKTGSAETRAATKGSLKAAASGAPSVKLASARAPSTKAPSVKTESTISRASSVADPDERAGLSLTKSGLNNPNPVSYGGVGQAERAFSAASTFLSGVLAISASQFIGAPLKLVDPKFYEAYMAWTKESFAVLMTTITQWWAPTVVRISGDESMKGQLYQMEDGSLKCNFPHRLVLMANHQLYTDWLYLWWVAYTNKMHGRIYIILKESMKQLPILGWGAQFYNFIFLSRNWETDKYRFKKSLNSLKNPKDPMWLLIFPEGTNLSAVTREKSAAWSVKSGIPDMKNQLLPRSTGLQFCLKELKATTNWLYDCTIAYEGVPKGQYGQDVFTLKSSFFEGRPPKSVNMFFRRFRISDIPVDNEDAFARWVLNRWREKDYILEYYYKFHQFPAEDAMKALSAVEGKRKPNHAKMIGTEVRGGGWDEFMSIFGPITSAAGALSSVDMTEPLNFDVLMAQLAKQQQLNLIKLGKAPLGAASQQAVRNALQAAQKSKALPGPVINYLMKELPQSQEGMQKALMAGAKHSGNDELAEKAAKAPAAKQRVPTQMEREAAQAAAQAQRLVDEASSSAKKGSAKKNATATSSGPSDRRQSSMINQEARITRPLSSFALDTATNSLGRTAGARPGGKSASVSGQTNGATNPPSSGTSKAAGVKQSRPQASSTASGPKSSNAAPASVSATANAKAAQAPLKQAQSAGSRR